MLANKREKVRFGTVIVYKSLCLVFLLGGEVKETYKEDIYQWFVSHFKGGKNYKKLSVQVRSVLFFWK